MSLALVLVALGLLMAGALLALCFASRDRVAFHTGSAAALAACAVGIGGALLFLLQPLPSGPVELHLPWSVPLGSFHVGLDALSAFFLFCLFLVSLLATAFGLGSMQEHVGQRRLAAPAALFNLLIASTALVLLARDGVLFLFAWELMSLSSFFLVTFEHDREEVRRAGFTYLIASHASLVFLMAYFGLFAQHAESFDFAAFAAAGPPAAAGTLFLLALAGFGTKAGFWPAHVWLPDAHPVAPGHVTSVLSGILIKVGVYGLLRALDFLGLPPLWWGALLVAVGLLSGLIGVVHALAQADIKRLLAYSSVENIGIVALGLGLGLIARSQGQPQLAFLGFAAALLHVLNHGLFKGLLFQAAGCAHHATHSRALDATGGLFKRMPVTGIAFLAGTLAISGLPPFNGFASEWLLFLTAFKSSATLPASAAVLAVAVLAGLALIGGLALACFARAFGIAFLGSPRHEAAERAREAPRAMLVSPVLAAALCLILGLAPQLGLALVANPAAALGGFPAAVIDPGLLLPITRLALVLVALVAVLLFARRLLLRRAEVRQAPTWGCGYAAPTARMQYTAASFSQPLLAVFAPLLPRRAPAEGPDGYFPLHARVEERVGDFAGERILRPLARRLSHALSRVRVIQHGKLHLYLVYVLVTLLVLLAWQLAT